MRITAALTIAPSAISDPGRVAGEPVEDRPQLEADEHEQQGVQHEDQDLPDGVALEPRLHGRQLGRVPADVDADGDRGEHGRDARGLGREVGEVAGEERDRDLGRRVVEPAPDLPQMTKPTASPIAIPPEHVDDEAPGRVPEREGAGQHRGDGEAVGDERGRVVDQALALDQRDEPARQPEPRGDRRRRDRVGRRDDRAEHEAHRPRQARR